MDAAGISLKGLVFKRYLPDNPAEKFVISDITVGGPNSL
jgi:hypothetical protein